MSQSPSCPPETVLKADREPAPTRLESFSAGQAEHGPGSVRTASRSLVSCSRVGFLLANADTLEWLPEIACSFPGNSQSAGRLRGR